MGKREQAVNTEPLTYERLVTEKFVFYTDSIDEAFAVQERLIAMRLPWFDKTFDSNRIRRAVEMAAGKTFLVVGGGTMGFQEGPAYAYKSFTLDQLPEYPQNIHDRYLTTLFNKLCDKIDTQQETINRLEEKIAGLENILKPQEIDKSFHRQQPGTNAGGI